MIDALEGTRQRLIIRALRTLGRTVLRIQSGRVKVRGAWMQLADAGTPDLYVLGWGWLETKTPTTDLNEAQRRMHRRIKAAGERVAVVRGPSDAVAAVGAAPSREATE